MAERNSIARPIVQILTPLYNEEKSFHAYVETVERILISRQDVEFRCVLVDDGSSDRTWDLIQQQCAASPRFRGLRLSRNFGAHTAETAGLDLCDADAVVILSADLQEYCRQLGLSGRVHFTGHVPAKDVPGLMAAADILLAPYQAQDFFYFSPIKIFEYMATARAVVAARVGQIPEIIQDGVNGMVYDPSAPGALGERLLRLVDHPELRRRLGEEARRTVESHYTWQNSAAGVIAALEQAMNCCRTRTN